MSISSIFNRTALDDEERQANSIIATVEERNEQDPKINKDPPNQCLFLCVHGKQQVRYAIRVPCHRPRLNMRTSDSEQEDGSASPPPSLTLGRSSFREKDSEVYKKLVAVCYQFHGNWKKWIPFYGIVDVRETQFYFNATTDKTGQFEIHLQPLDIDPIAEEKLSQGKDYYLFQNRYDRRGGLLVNLNLKKYYLMKACALEPSKADRLSFSFLNGMALTSSPILDNRRFDSPSGMLKNHRPIHHLPGIEIALGWQTDRIIDEVPSNMTAIWFLLTIVWVAVVAGGIVGDGNIWIAIGQLLVASFALLLSHLKQSR